MDNLFKIDCIYILRPDTIIIIITLYIYYIYIYIYITLQIHSVEHLYRLGGESLRETFTICIMHRSLLAV